MKVQDPAFMPHLARPNVPAERGGASYRASVTAEAPTVAHEAGALQAHGRVLPSAINRSSAFEFELGEQEMF
jgi:hypothetical protein